MRKKADQDDVIPAVFPNQLSSKEFRQNWARLIQQTYVIDLLFFWYFIQPGTGF